MRRPRRSALYSPADQAELLSKAVEGAADAVIFDLEDSVAIDAKATARANVVEVIPSLDADCEVGVRVNAVGTDHFTDDIEAVIAAGADAVVLPMVTAGDDVRRAWSALTERTDDPPLLRIAIETPPGIHNGPAIARASRETGVVSLTFGFADYCKSLGTPGTPDRIRERLEMLTAEFASMADVEPVASVHLDLDDDEGLRRVAERARETGFAGMAAIHPEQVPVINDVFTPDQDEVRKARRLVDAFDESEKDSLRVEGVFLDTATVDRYRRLLERAPE